MRALLIFGLILGFPVLEAWLLFRLGDQFGFWVVVWLGIAVVLGVLLIRVEKLVWAVRIAASLREQRSPLTALLASARSVIAGVLLIFPGVITDVIALALLIWPLPKARPLDSMKATGVIEGEYRRETTVERLPPGGGTARDRGSP
jgi:UPF0716 protein FxsA